MTRLEELKQSVAELTHAYHMAYATGNYEWIAAAADALALEKAELDKEMRRKFQRQRKAIAQQWKAKAAQ